MEWTGELYGFYSNKSHEEMRQELLTLLDDMKYETEFFETGLEEWSYFYYQNTAMREYHLEHGYNTSLNGLGCSSLDVSKTKLRGTFEMLEFEESAFESMHETTFVFSVVYYYLLVVPHNISECEFSNAVYNGLKKVLSSNTSLDDI